MTLLEITNLAVTYHTNRGAVPAVEEVNLRVEAGRVTAIVGESGSGKSTSAMAALGLLPPTAEVTGSVKLNGRGLLGLSERQWRSIRGTTIGLIPQDPGNSLNPVKTIGGSVGEVLRIHRRATGNLNRAQRKAKVIDLLDTVGIDNPELRYRQFPHQLSGGMRQRALIAAALAGDPDLIIADEATSALDVTVQRTILDLLSRLCTERGIGILFITHDLAVAGDRADHMVVMKGGRVVEAGLTGRILTDPQDPYTARLLADVPSLTSPVTRGERDRKRNRVASQNNDEETDRPLLTVDRLRREFNSKRGDGFVAVNDVSFDVDRGTTHAIVGQSGSGKSTLARMITAFDQPTSGHVALGDTRIDTLDAAGRRTLRTQMQLVYQNPFSSLDPRHSIARIIGEPLHNLTDHGSEHINDRVLQMLEKVALPANLADRRPTELSGGQAQRVAIARALILEPELLVLDEAVSALDVTVQAQILKLLDELQEALGLTYVFISHDLSVVREISDTVSVMQHGTQVEYGPTANIFDNPQTDFTRELLDAIPGQRYRSGVFNLGL